MQQTILVLGIILALVLAGLTVHLVLTWMDRRGWVWYRNPNRARPSSLGLVEEIYQPSVEHVTDHAIEDETLADQSESGQQDPDEPTDEERDAI